MYLRALFLLPEIGAFHRHGLVPVGMIMKFRRCLFVLLAFFRQTDFMAASGDLPGGTGAPSESVAERIMVAVLYFMSPPICL